MIRQRCLAKKAPSVLQRALLAAFLAALGSSLMSCGIEMYKYLAPVDPGITMRLNTTAYIALPTENYAYNYFRYFVIYYRIYISDIPVEVVDTELLAQINPALHTDYNFFLSYTNSQSTAVPTTMGTTFSNRKYFPLELRNASIETVLGSGINFITLEFAANPPALVIGDLREQPGGTRHLLSRNRRNNNTPYADNYYFVNSDDVNNNAHISSDSSYINQDVERNTQASGAKYTYAAMYIVAYGMDDANFSNIYSIPTFIGIFRLPDE
jgi:hypothetical protein